MLRGAFSCKISRLANDKTTYPVEISMRSCQLREPLFTHKGHDKGVVRQAFGVGQAMHRSDRGAFRVHLLEPSLDYKQLIMQES